MNILLDGGSVFINNWRLITGILGFITIIILPIFFCLKSDASPGSRRRIRPVFSSTSIVLALFIFLSLLLRLAYLSKALFPSYFDSAQHYAMIKNILTQDLPQIFESMRMNYYHMGFHFATAFFTSIFQTEITTVMLVFGQIILTALPLPLFFIVRYVTRSNWAGMLTAILSAFGWYMPAHAVDWGKYPALMSLGMIIFILSLAYVFLDNKKLLPARKHILLYGMLGASTLVTTFVHSRALIVLGMVAFVWIVSLWWRRLPRLHKHLIFSLLIITLIVEVILVQQRDVLSLLFDPYLNKGVWVTALVLFLAVFAYRHFPQLTFVNLAVVCLLIASLFVPVTGLFPGRDYLTLMDRPYVEMILFMPLSLLGGLGFAGLEKMIRGSFQRVVVFIVIGLVLAQAFASYEFYPSKCCVLVGNDDVAAMAWMADQLPVQARIGIASTELKVVAEDVVEGDVGADAGIWVTPLTDRVTILLPYDLEFDQQIALDMICQRGVEYIFVGELGQPFDITRLNSRPVWYRPLLSMPKIGVYEVTGCKL